jgi:hypothetical protein
MMKPFDQAGLPAAVQVPAGNKVFWETVGVGEITYECRAKAGAAGQFEWVFVGPDAKAERPRRQAGGQVLRPARHLGRHGRREADRHAGGRGPGRRGQHPAATGEGQPGHGHGMVSGTTYIQRVATMGGVAPAAPCGAGNMGAKQIVKYQADYIFWRAA